MSQTCPVGVIGAASLVGRQIVPLLAHRGRVVACSRRIVPQPDGTQDGVLWHPTGVPLPAKFGPVPEWVALCPLWAVPDRCGWLEQSGIQRLVAVSSMSVVTKASSPHAAERDVAKRLADAEDDLAAWADGRGLSLTILRPTMIYDGCSDGNVAAIAACVRRLGWFPLCGAGSGLRQPVHAADVAAACLAALECRPQRRCYSLSGGEALPFRDLVARTCQAHGLTPRVVSLPGWAWRALAGMARVLGVTDGITSGVGRRMNEDLSCSHAEASAELGFRPRPFVPAAARARESTDATGSLPARR
jgi:nucleoside-diphosphate-sugar epimerase